jgi:hypothetical protein
VGWMVPGFLCTIAMKSRKYQAGVADADLEETISRLCCATTLQRNEPHSKRASGSRKAVALAISCIEAKVPHTKEGQKLWIPYWRSTRSPLAE